MRKGFWGIMRKGLLCGNGIIKTIYLLYFPVPILAASDLIQALTLIIATFGFYSDFFITFDRSKTGGE